MKVRRSQPQQSRTQTPFHGQVIKIRLFSGRTGNNGGQVLRFRTMSKCFPKVFCWEIVSVTRAPRRLDPVSGEQSQ